LETGGVGGVGGEVDVVDKARLKKSIIS
jgi:hypothetical protein